MALDTYNNLQASIANWLSRSDLTLEIPDFIRIAESAINKKVSITEYETSVYIELTGGQDNYEMPIDYKYFRNVWIEGYRNYPLSYVTPTQFSTKVTGNNLSGGTNLYTIKGDRLILGPAPLQDQILNIDYVAMLLPLSDTNQSNFLTQQSPETIFFGALMEACSFIKDSEGEAKWGAKFGGSLTLLIDLVEEMRYSGEPLRITTG